MTLQSLINAHKWISVLASLFVIVLTGTGILLLHTDDLKLYQHKIKNVWLLSHYGVNSDPEAIFYTTGSTWISQLEDQLYYNAIPIRQTEESLIGAEKTEGIYILAFPSSLLLINDEQQIIEHITPMLGLPRGLKKFKILAPDQILVKNDDGIYVSDSKLSSWSKIDDMHIIWQEASEPPDTLRQALLSHYQGEGPSLEQLLLDIHSGRIAGTLGLIIMDIAVVVFLLMSITGWWLWYKRYKTRIGKYYYKDF